MPSVTGGQAAVETSDVLLSFGEETAWGTKPNTAFQALRITGESLTGQKQRGRASEITKVKQRAKGFTNQESAGGGINLALSFGTFDSLFAAVMGNDWSTPLAINGASADISTVAAGNKLTSTTANKFSAIVVGQWIRLLGFTANGGANNGFARVIAKTSNQDITLAGKTVTDETPTGTNAKIRGSMLVNDNQTQSRFLQKQLGTAGFLHYPGSIISGASLTGGVGNAFTGSFQAICQDEVRSAVNGSTGAVLDAPTGGFHDPVGNFGGVWLDDAPLQANVQSTSVNMTREGAEMDYAMGSPKAVGARWGMFGVDGDATLFFKDFDLWTRAKAETQGRFAFLTRDDAGNGYIFEHLGAILLNPQVVAGGPGQAVAVQYTIEGNPSGDAVNRTFAIHRLPIA
ncbi:phage tail tube protein [Roseomonas sp. USHLN139]|uniref:phage tail tube protein n=1 Tax=Roseomonas sp. USHLN139 TaxID=3081298 RepID=UPI003B01B5F7